MWDQGPVNRLDPFLSRMAWKVPKMGFTFIRAWSHCPTQLNLTGVRCCGHSTGQKVASLLSVWACSWACSELLDWQRTGDFLVQLSWVEFLDPTQLILVGQLRDHNAQTPVDDDDDEIAYFTVRWKTRELVLSTAPKTWDNTDKDSKNRKRSH